MVSIRHCVKWDAIAECATVKVISISPDLSEWSTQINGTAALATGSWQHVAVTLAGTAGTLYVNGVAVGTATISINPSNLGTTTQNYIGKSQWADPNLTGSVDDFRIYSRALNATEVAALANPFRPPRPVSPPLPATRK